MKVNKTLYFSTMQNRSCLNCENPVMEHQQFCSVCGQKTTVHRLTLHDVGHDAIHYFTHADKGIFSLLGQLIRKPGLVAREYVEGKRKKYFPPLNFFLIVAAVFVFMVNILNSGSTTTVITAEQRGNVSKMPDGPGKLAILARFDRIERAVRTINRYGNFIAMIATPLISVLIYLLYRGGKYSYTEHLVANMYISGFTVLMYAIVFSPLSKLLNLDRLNFILLLYFTFEIFYRGVSYYYFMNKGTARSAVKAYAVSFIAILFWASFTFTMNYLYIAHGFWGLIT